jgi:hypothetical protein
LSIDIDSAQHRSKLRLFREFTMRASTWSQRLAIAALPIGLIVALGTPGAGQRAQAADPSNFGVITLSDANPLPNTRPGRTGGSYSLAALANRDRDNNTCLGYGDSRPDYILVLPKDLDRLQLQVDSGGRDTTLVVEGPDGFRCSDDGPAPSAGAAPSADAQLSNNKWKAGRYRIWIGTVNPADSQNYRLIVKL